MHIQRFVSVIPNYAKNRQIPLKEAYPIASIADSAQDSVHFAQQKRAKLKPLSFHYWPALALFERRVQAYYKQHGLKPLSPEVAEWLYQNYSKPIQSSDAIDGAFEAREARLIHTIARLERRATLESITIDKSAKMIPRFQQITTVLHRLADLYQERAKHRPFQPWLTELANVMRRQGDWFNGREHEYLFRGGNLQSIAHRIDLKVGIHDQYSWCEAPALSEKLLCIALALKEIAHGAENNYVPLLLERMSELYQDTHRLSKAAAYMHRKSIIIPQQSLESRWLDEENLKDVLARYRNQITQALTYKHRKQKHLKKVIRWIQQETIPLWAIYRLHAEGGLPDTVLDAMNAQIQKKESQKALRSFKAHMGKA